MIGVGTEVPLLFSFHDQRGAVVAGTQQTADPLSQGDIAILHLPPGMRFTAELAYALDDLGHPATIGGMVVA